MIAYMLSYGYKITIGTQYRMYTVEFYEDDKGKSELWDFLEELREHSLSSKDARIQYKQISL